ncbi:MAG: hypothetical protein JO208_11510 [Alphaproteobacteria bacterium]|nr:hypothetical protein [Alphaproteobacteria bacterium]
MFESAYLKIDRAKKHVHDLQTLLHKYANAARIEFEPEGRFITVYVDPKVEVDSALVIGDAAHNLRSALDHAYWELLGIDTGGKQPKGATLPIHCDGTGESYEGSIKGIKKATPSIREDTIKLLTSLEAYGGWDNRLCALHSLDIGDKHKLLTTVFSITSLRECIVIKPDGTREPWRRLGTFFFNKVDGSAVITPFDKGDRFDIHSKPQPALNILFGDIEYLDIQNVMTGFVILEREVRSVLKRMETMLERRGGTMGQGS